MELSGACLHPLLQWESLTPQEGLNTSSRITPQTAAQSLRRAELTWVLLDWVYPTLQNSSCPGVALASVFAGFL